MGQANGIKGTTSQLTQAFFFFFVFSLFYLDLTQTGRIRPYIPFRAGRSFVFMIDLAYPTLALCGYNAIYNQVSS